jgi:hypothetical protein
MQLKARGCVKPGMAGVLPAIFSMMLKLNVLTRMTRVSGGVLGGLLALAMGPALPARDAYVLISGGGTPLNNNYSQYLQARAMAGYFRGHYPADSTWVFFGAGNREGEPVALADVRKQYKRDGLLLESWEPGFLPANRPATRESILAALRDEILPAVADGGTLYLFVGDHGELSRGPAPESVITLWKMKGDPARPGGWYTDDKETLGVAELQAVLRAGLGRGQMVFCMTQCHSGGFHYLGVPRAVAPDSNWFRTVPLWAVPDEAAPLPRVAGFTATDEESLAAGCDPDPDPDKWAGYERFVPEALLGRDLFTMAATGPALGSFAAAHQAAVAVDRTIDKPRTSAEQYLERWASLIETKLAAGADLTPAVRDQVAAYQRAVDTGVAAAADPLFRERQAEFARYEARLAEQNPRAGDLAANGTRGILERVIGPAAQRPGAPEGGRPRGPRKDLLAAWNDTLRPAWKQAVEAGAVKALPPVAADFERHLLGLEDRGRQFMVFRGWQNPLLNEIFWGSGYAFPDKLNAAKAEAVARWGAERRGRILAWGRQADDGSVRAAAELLTRALGRQSPVAGAAKPVEEAGHASQRPLSRKTAAERILFYRRVLAAWAFLIATDDRPALEELHALITLENTPLPATRR